MAKRDDYKIMDKKAPFIVLTNFAEKYNIVPEYNKGYWYLVHNLDSLPLLEKEKSELKKILQQLLKFEGD
jgi:hypothetical protein